MHVLQTEVILRHEGAELARVTLPPGDYVIGRHADVEIFADTPLISRRHAQLTINYDHLLIEDLGSSNGTFVNEQRIAEATRLYPNQPVRLGDVVVEIRRQRAPSEPGVSLAPAQAAIRRFLPEEILAEKRYAIGSEIARGGMGAILDARQNATQRTVAMKVMLGSGGEGDVLRFIEEAQITAQLDHPNIVPIYELGVDEQDQLFYTMKLVRGITLKRVLELLAEGIEATVKKYPLPALLTIFQKVCDAVAFAHAKGVIHRDLKPENIMLGDFGSVLVMDWGLAKVMPRGGHRAVDAPDHGTDGAVPSNRSFVMSARASAPEFGSTMAGDILGTPQYMAPEQARGEVETLDPRADIYALGAILFHILHLRPSVTGGDAMEIVGKVERGEIAWVSGRVGVPPAESGASPDGLGKLKVRGRETRPPAGGTPTLPGKRALPESLLAVCRKALALDRERRYPRVEDLQADILAYQNGFATSAERATAGKQFALFVRRNKAASIGVAAVLIVGGVLGTRAILEGQRAQRGEALARSEATRAEREAAAAKATLADLRRTAPVFYAQAKVDFEEGNFEAAIEKIGYAIQLDDTAADYHLFRANLRESAQDLAAAAEGYRRVLALRPADAAAKTNLALCEKLSGESGGADLQIDQQRQLLAALRTQKRLVESAPLAALIDPNTAAAKAALLARLHEWVKQPEWKKSSIGDRLLALPDGTFHVNLLHLAPGDLSVLKGQPVSVLGLNDTGIADLSSLAGLPLKTLNLQGAKATDLSPLRGMPLESLILNKTPASDLSPLHGMKLQTLALEDTAVSDLSPLAGMPLTWLNCADCKALRDLSPLRGAPLRTLRFRGSPITSLAPLAGAPLQSLTLDAIAATDLTPLAQCVDLETLVLRRTPVADLTPLAKLHLTSLDLFDTKVTSLAPLRGQPLRFLDLRAPGVKDLTPLADCAALEEIILPNNGADPTPLRGLPRLRFISSRVVSGSNHPAQTAEEFWKEYDAQPAAGKK